MAALLEDLNREDYMTLFDLLILLLVAGICGALGQAITGFSRGGCLVSIALGFVGAVAGYVAGSNDGSAGTLCRTDRHDQLPNRVVNYRFRAVRGNHYVTNKTLLLV